VQPDSQTPLLLLLWLLLLLLLLSREPAAPVLLLPWPLTAVVSSESFAVICSIGPVQDMV
jgi:hypothetical protein